jgi:AhpD family alkylhydroperoxidase
MERINIGTVEPAAYQAMLALEKYLHSSSLEPLHKELIKIRASQINGCAFCINMHTKDARKLGETEQRIYLLNAWREVDNLYDEKERAILALTEEITLISKGVSEETYQKAASLFDEHYLAQIIIAITTINAWNRISISTRSQPQ